MLERNWETWKGPVAAVPGMLTGIGVVAIRSLIVKVTAGEYISSWVGF